MPLYTTQAVDAPVASTEEIEAALVESKAADKVAERQATADEVQAYINGDPKLTVCWIVASPDKDPAFVVITFDPDILAEDSKKGGICAGALAVITTPGIGANVREKVGDYGFRAEKDAAIAHLYSISAQL
jgi:hypothetical protein